MADREKVISEFEDFVKSFSKRNDTYYKGLFGSVLALLKEQPQIVRCKDCRYGQYCTDGETTYQCFKWNSNEFGALHEQDWFCADGERK